MLVTYTQLEVNGLHQPKEYVLTDSNVDTDPAWSADAHWLAFTSERDGNLEIYLMPTTGRPQINLSQSPGVDRSPDWLPLPDSYLVELNRKSPNRGFFVKSIG